MTVIASPPPLDAFACLEGARVLRRLGRGPVCDSWLLATGTGRLVLRRDRPLAARLGLDRDNERRVLDALGGVGPAPALVVADPGRGLLVTRYVPGEPWRPAQLRDHDRLRGLGRLLRRVHDGPVVGKRFAPARIAAGYAREAGGRSAARLAREAERLAGPLYPPAGEWRMCHHDPHAGNVAGRRPARLLDWEYAAVGQPLMDLAVVARFHRLGDARRAALAHGWSGAAPSTETLRAVAAFGQLYDRLAELWGMVVARHGGI